MKNLILLILLMFLALFGSGCEEIDDPASAGELKEGTIIYAGEFESDGWGWLIQIDTTFYFPVNLNKSMENADQDILVSFEVLDEKVTCGFPSSTAPQYSQIKLLEIIPK